MVTHFPSMPMQDADALTCYVSVLTGIAAFDSKLVPRMSRSPVNSFVDDYTPALLAQASQLISGEFHIIVQTAGFEVSDWRVLSTLSGGEAMSIGHLAQVSVTKQPTVTRLLDRMEAQGHVKRIPHETDRRITLVRITPQGQELVSALIRQAKAHEDRVLAALGKGKAAELKATLRLLLDLHRPPA
ncbi:DNA-binding transcriptional regulator, MarR family [Burkholderia sp. CF099]|nr:DNA-binding transcriptional regulator, MarR family [Burkholderia sp. CF099]